MRGFSAASGAGAHVSVSTDPCGQGTWGAGRQLRCPRGGLLWKTGRVIDGVSRLLRPPSSDRRIPLPLLQTCTSCPGPDPKVCCHAGCHSAYSAPVSGRVGIQLVEAGIGSWNTVWMRAAGLGW